MKKIKFFTSILTVGIILVLNSCNQEKVTISEHLPEQKSPFQKLKENPELINSSNFNVKIIDSLKPRIIEKEEGDNEIVGRDSKFSCCLKCDANITFVGGPSNPNGNGYSLSIVRTCTNDINEILNLGQGVEVVTFDEGANPYGSSSTFEIIDEHFYWYLAIVYEYGTIKITVEDSSPVPHNISIPDSFGAGLNSLIGGYLNCDLISYSQCWNWNEGDPLPTRICCYE